MAVKTGDRAPDFSAELSDGTKVSLHELLKEGPIVLFFYPKAFTPGCTAQSCRFRDLSKELSAFGARPIGVSSDDPETLESFGKTNRLGYQLISDAEGTIAKIFGAKRLGLPFARRMTFVIDDEGRVLEMIRNELDMDVHADRALEVLRDRQVSDLAVPDLEAGSN